MGIIDSVLSLTPGTPHKAARGLVDALGRGSKEYIDLQRRSMRATYKYSGAKELVDGTVSGVKHPIRRLKGEDAPWTTLVINGKPQRVQMMTGEVPMGPGRAFKYTAEKMMANGAKTMHVGTDNLEATLDAVSKAGHKNVHVIKMGKNGPDYGGTQDIKRHPVVLGPEGKVYVPDKPGYHHHDVGQKAGLPDDWHKPGSGYHQADLKDYGKHTGISEPTFSAGGWMEGSVGRLTDKNYEGVARLRNAMDRQGTKWHGSPKDLRDAEAAAGAGVTRSNPKQEWIQRRNVPDPKTGVYPVKAGWEDTLTPQQRKLLLARRK